ncbi:MAG: hypothetical protein JJU05_09760 [Verrucomicrobia bacterium]|nr:hypothetical protein [Verrucomicrobiota bacterium]MCH8527566.1 hypothetical protein [Kiritimatiellia bacterium]
MNTRRFPPCLALLITSTLLWTAPASGAEVLPWPEGTRVETSFKTQPGREAGNLIDGNRNTSMIGAEGSVATETTPTSIYFHFPEPVRGLGGVETGDSDPHHNYFPIEMEFWADSNGDGKFETKLGEVDGLGPADQSAGRHLFRSRLEQTHGLELRVTRQSARAVRRAFQLNHAALLRSDAPPIVQPAPPEKQQLYFTRPIPEDSKIRADFETEQNRGPELLLDGDRDTFMTPAGGTVRRTNSVFLDFPAPVHDLAGVTLGRGDIYRNYIWETLEIHVDTTGDGVYDRLAATLEGGGQGEFRFPETVDIVHGIEFRATRQRTAGAGRAFILSTIGDLIFADDPGDSSMIFIIEDFEDFGSWRTWGINTAHPEDERMYGKNLWLSGVHDPDRAYRGEGVGEFRYWFGDATPRRLWAKRAVVSAEEALVEEIRFMANPLGYSARIWFELTDRENRKFQTPAVTVEGRDWQQYRIPVNADSIRQFRNLNPPFKLEMIFMEGATAGKGDVLLDDIAFVGSVDRSRRVQIKRVYEGMTYDPEQSVAPAYQVRNVQGRDVTIPLRAELYSSFDPRLTQPLADQVLELTLAPYESRDVRIDFGHLEVGHYLARLTVNAPGIEVSHLDLIPVAVLNGERVNESPMWFGSMHPMDWLATPENEFVQRNVIRKLGMDAYRTSAPPEWMREYNMLAAAGFGWIPPHLRKPGDDHRGEPSDYEGYYEWVRQQAEEKYLPHKDMILSVEFYNEPDLPGFEYFPGIDTYLKMHETFRRAFRDVIPDVRIGTGGNTVFHGREKPDFNRRMYTELAQEAEVAIFHAHGSLENYITRHRQVETWLKEGGVQPVDALIGNSEAGFTSGSEPTGWLNQADNLVRKIGWASAQGNSLFYIWFTTTDTYDPQGGYLYEENWGLVNFRQRLKPSGQAYNELIRQLANTEPYGDVELDAQLHTVHFRRKTDGAGIWLTWPHQRGARFVTPILAEGPVTVTDIFGHSQILEPEGGRIRLRIEGYPLYLTAAEGVQLEPDTGSEWVDLPSAVGGLPGSTPALTVNLRTPPETSGSAILRILDTENNLVASKEVHLQAGSAQEPSLKIPIDPSMDWGAHGYSLQIDSDIEAMNGLFLPFTVAVSIPVPAAGPFEIDGIPAELDRAHTIVLDDEDAVHDFAYDPSTPYWAGPEDLSVRAEFAHDRQGLYASFVVTDDVHIPGAPGGTLWNGDSIQLGVAARGTQTQIGLTEAGGGSGWCWENTAGDMAAKELKTPLAVKRVGNQTVYEVYLPFSDLGFDYEPRLQIRLSFLVNEADQPGGRVRVMRWFDGIVAGQGSERYGYMILE